MDACTDLASWVQPSTVLAWVAEEVEMLNRVAPGAKKVLLCALGYAYARRIFDGAEIARACRVDPVLQPLCGDSPPFATELRTFRRRSRQVLERLLTRVFTRAYRHRFELAGVDLPEELVNKLRSLAAERLDLARHMDAGEC